MLGHIHVTAEVIGQPTSVAHADSHGDPRKTLALTRARVDGMPFIDIKPKPMKK